jgi:chromosome segregation ATPase
MGAYLRNYSQLNIRRPGGVGMVQSADNGKIQVLEERVDNLSQLVSKHENQIERLNEQVIGLTQANTETKVYVSQIFTILEDIKTQLRILQDKSDRNNDSDNNRWIDFLKQIVFLGVGALVTYLMTK